MSIYYVEHRLTQRRIGPVKLVPLAEINNYSGFRSVFCFDPDVAEYITELNTTRDLRGKPLYSEQLFIDFDNKDPSLFRQFLESESIGYDEYLSGNRSHHFHIDIEPMSGPGIAADQKEWVRRNADGADVSYFHAAGLYRIAGTVHEKTGRKKEKIRSFSGNKLKIGPAAQKDINLSNMSEVDSDATKESLISLLTRNVQVGGRRPRAWLISVTCAELGISFEECCAHLFWWNKNILSDPHPETELEKQAASAYQHVGRKFK